MLDTFRADYLADYGGRPSMKFLESLAKKSVIFKHAIAPGDCTIASHLSIFTGKRARNIKGLSKWSGKGVSDKIQKYLSENEMTLSQKLEYFGYKSALFAANPFLDEVMDISTGFSYIKDGEVSLSGASFLTSKLAPSGGVVRSTVAGVISVLSLILSKKQLNDLFLLVKQKLSKRQGAYALDYGAALINQQVSEYLAKKRTQQPNFIFINFMEAHERYPTNLVTDEYVEQDVWMYMSHTISSESISTLKQACQKRLMYLDTQLRKLTNTLRRRGLLDNAVLIVSSDHGQAFMEHDQMYHSVFPYEQVAHVPLLMSRFSNGRQLNVRREIDGFFSETALFDIISDMAYGGTDVHSIKAGNNVVFSDRIDTIKWGGTKLVKKFRHKVAYFDAICRTEERFNAEVSAIYRWPYKLMHFYNDPLKDELYNISEDPEEAHNIIGDNKRTARELVREDRVSLRGAAGQQTQR